MSQHAYLSQPDPEWLEVASQYEGGTTSADLVEQLGIGNLRAQTNAAFKGLSAKRGAPLTAGINVTDRDIPVENGFITLRTYVPQLNTTLGEVESTHFPLLSWTYGGGFWCGTLDNDDVLLRELAIEFRIVIVSVDYRKAPEFPFPTPVNDVYAGIQWAFTYRDQIMVDMRKGFIIGGLSAGGSLAAAATRRAVVDHDLPQLTGQLLVIPVLIDPTAYPEKFKDRLLSLDQNKQAPLLSKRSTMWFSDFYYGSKGSDPEASPLLSQASEFQKLPPAYLQISGLDPLRDEGLLYEELLREAGVSTKLDIYPGQPHGFHIFHPEFKASKKQHKDAKEGLRWLLSNKKLQA